MLPLILSIIIPGLGQFYYGKNVRAILMVLISLTPLYPLAWIWSIIDICILNKQDIQTVFDKKEAVWTVVLFLVVIPLCLSVTAWKMFSTFKWYSNSFMKANATIEEGNAIASSMENYHKDIGKYPPSISKLVQGRPIRASWKKDGWGESYFYEIVNDGQAFTLISKGKDKILGTEDDLVFKDSNK